MKKESRKEIIVLSVVFAVMLLANIFSPLCIDDFVYAFSTVTQERITSFSELIPSAVAHSANGRIIACFVIQLCLMFPKIVFNIANSLMFVFQIVLIRCLVCAGQGKSWKILLGGAGLIWCFIPAFGEDYLWLCAAALYAWGATLGLLFTSYFSKYLHGENGYRPIQQAGICVLAFLLGAYGETTSIVAVSVPVLYCLAARFICGKRVRPWMLFSELSGLCGLWFLLTRPGEGIKTSSPSLLKYLTNLEVLIIRYIDAFGVLLAFFGLFIVYVLIRMWKGKKKYTLSHFVDSIIYMLVSLGISGGMIITSVYPLRVMLLTGLFLFLAVLSFIYAARDIIHYDTKFWKTAYAVVGAGMILVTLYGMYEICDYGLQINKLYKEIERQAKAGETDIVVSECPEYDSKYICYNEYPYFNTDPLNYVNVHFMRYMNYEGTVRAGK